jgi:hypothetical protein
VIVLLDYLALFHHGAKHGLVPRSTARLLAAAEAEVAIGYEAQRKGPAWGSVGMAGLFFGGKQKSSTMMVYKWLVPASTATKPTWVKDGGGCAMALPVDAR